LKRAAGGTVFLAPVSAVALPCLAKISDHSLKKIWGHGNNKVILNATRPFFNFPMIPLKKTCFLIDDDVDDQEIFMMALSQIGIQFECTVVNNGNDGLLKLKKEPVLPDYIFLDLNMPRMNGKECLKELKKNERLRNIPVIIYTTSSSKSDIADTLKLGAAGFITKPFSLKELTETLTHFFQKENEKESVSIFLSNP
jgi:CheY-like chemotaxis protein